MTSLLVFSIGGVTYGVDARGVLGVVPRPALIPVGGAAAHVAGLFDLGGRLIPVIDLAAWTERIARAPRHSDAIVVLGDGTDYLGIVAEHLHDVRVPSEDAIVALPDWLAAPADGVTPAAARIENRIVLLPDQQRLLRLAEEATGSAAATVGRNGADVSDPVSRNASAALPADEVFAERAQALAIPLETAEGSEPDLLLAVIRLGGETLGIPARTVREFCRVSRITPIPCCPPHILGHANLRGELITVVDLSGVLHTRSAAAEGQRTLAVVETAGVVAGIAVDEAVTVVAVHASELGPLPPAVDSGARPFFLGTAASRLGVVTVLDLDAILAGGALAVDEGM